MTVVASNWLPSNALTDPALAGLLSRALQPWWTRWFGDAGFEVAVAPVVHDADGEATAENAVNSRSLPPKDIACRALGVSHEQALRASQSDAAVLVALGSSIQAEAIADLQAFLDRHSHAVSDTHTTDVGTWAVTIGAPRDTPWLTLNATTAQLIAARRSLMCPVVRRSSPGINLQVALAGARCDIAAHLGRTRVPIPALRELAVGDVLILDRDANPTVVLQTTTSGTRVCGAMLQLSDDGLKAVVNA